MSVVSPTTRRIISRLRPPPYFPLPKTPWMSQCRFFNSTLSKRAPAGHQRTWPKHSRAHNSALIAGAASLVLAVSLYCAAPTKCDAPNQHLISHQADARDPSLPRFRLSDVRKHDGTSGHPWVIFGDKVYDITDWIEAHPGGDVILRAAGGSIEAYWDIFAIHKNDYVYDILKQYLIGFIDVADLVDGKPAREEIEDPFSDDPERHPDLITMTAKPRNAETPADSMTSDFLTPNDLFYVRNHMWVPSITDNPGKHTLTVELPDGTEKVYTLHDLKTKFPTRRVTAALQCSGNRRSHMSEASGRKANGLPWKVGAISNACWEGVLLSDVLNDAGFDVTEGIAGTSEAKHVQFSGLEAYGASIPIKKAVDPQGDVLLAYGMNGQPLPRDHGFPLRAIVPGHVAARSVKWLSRVTLSDEESWSQWQRRDYKCFGPNQIDVDWETAPAIQEMPVQSAITKCKLSAWKKANEEENQGNGQEPKKREDPYVQRAFLTGYAYSGGGRAIVRVDVSLDGGKSWSQASILPDCLAKDGQDSLFPCFGHGSWSWRRWTFEGVVPKGAFSPITGQENEATEKRSATFVVKATDESYNTQPESHAATWNVRGNLATAWHRLVVYSNAPDASGTGGSGGSSSDGGSSSGSSDSGSSGGSSDTGSSGSTGSTTTSSGGGGGFEGPDDPYEGWENI